MQILGNVLDKTKPFLLKEFSLSLGMIFLAIRPMAYYLVLRETDINELW